MYYLIDFKLSSVKPKATFDPCNSLVPVADNHFSSCWLQQLQKFPEWFLFLPDSNSAVKQWYVKHLSLKSPMVKFYKAAVWHLTHQTSHWMQSFYPSFLLLKCAPSFFALEKNAWFMKHYFLPVTEQKWGSDGEERERERERERTRLKSILLGCMKVMEWAEICSGSRCVPEGVELLLLWPLSCKWGGACRLLL